MVLSLMVLFSVAIPVSRQELWLCRVPAAGAQPRQTLRRCKAGTNPFQSAGSAKLEVELIRGLFGKVDLESDEPIVGRHFSLACGFDSHNSGDHGIGTSVQPGQLVKAIAFKTSPRGDLTEVRLKRRHEVPFVDLDVASEREHCRIFAIGQTGYHACQDALP